MKIRIVQTALAACLGVCGASIAVAAPLLERAEAGQPIRLVFSNLKPGSYVGDNGQPTGRMNVIAMGVLKTMGYPRVEAVVMDYAGQIPAIQADRADIVTGGLYITKERCANIAFSNPVAVSYEVLLVPKGNPKKLENYSDIASQGATLVTITGYSSVVENSKKGGVEKMLMLPGTTQALAALRAGRADAFATSFTEAKTAVELTKEEFETAAHERMPADTKFYIAYGFRRNDVDFIAKFNKALSVYLGSPEMMKDLKNQGYDKATLPDGKSAAEACQLKQ
ncbi:polar amino acid transport system substrate-binding protein [Bradyrhizobium japonicum]